MGEDFFSTSDGTLDNIIESIIQKMDEVLLFIDQDYHIRVFNQAANIHFGQLSNLAINPGESFLELIQNLDQHEKFINYLREGFSGKNITFRMRHSIDPETMVNFEYKIQPIRDIKENISGILIQGIALSILSDNEDNNPESKDLFDSFFHRVQDPALLWKRTSNNVILLDRYNPLADKNSLGNIKTWVGKSIEEFFEDRPDIQQRFYDCFESGLNTRYETQYQLKTTGERKWLQANLIKINDEYLLNTTIDITEQKETEFVLLENQRRLLTLLENLPGMGYRCKNDEHWTMEFISAGSVALTGYQLGDLKRNNRISYEQIIHPDDRIKVRTLVNDAIESHQIFEINYRIQTADHKEKWVWEKGHGIYDEQGDVQAIEGYIFDITERIHSEQAAEKAINQSKALKQALDELSSQLDLSQVLRRILVSLKTVLEYDSATLFLKEEEKYKVVAARGFTNTSRLINRTLPTTNLLLKEIENLKAPIILNNAQDDPRFERWETANQVRGWMGVPLIRHDEFIGLMTIDNYRTAAYTQEDAKLASSFANSAAVVIENAKLFEQTQKMALTDSLTGVFNRRYFYELSQREFTRSKRYQSPMSIILIDIDHFKNVNDRFGHLAGDQVLVQFVQRIQDELRTNDILARFGGEEFIILLPETNMDDATHVAERLREVTAHYPFLLITAQTYITISLGISSFRFSTISLDHLIDESDKALYEAKQLGRNRVKTYQQK